MAIDAVSAVGSASATGRTRLTESFDTFLTLLTTQLRNQDPLSPMDSTQFTQQLVQMTSVEQQLVTNDLLESLVANSGAGVGTAVALIDKEIQASFAGAALTKDGADWTYALDRDASDVKLEILDEKGRVVRAFAPEDNKAGQHKLHWDGKTTDGSKLAPGETYTMRITAKDSQGATVTNDIFQQGVVTGVQQVAGQALISVNGVRIPLGAITAVREQPKPASTETTTTVASTDDNSPDDKTSSIPAA